MMNLNKDQRRWGTCPVVFLAVLNAVEEERVGRMCSRGLGFRSYGPSSSPKLLRRQGVDRVPFRVELNLTVPSNQTDLRLVLMTVHQNLVAQPELQVERYKPVIINGSD
ncbi:hypothetical protein PM082_020109 [Marasmius tenuissimus]|nr:hypothetical protein PM082_020109 [Marasmius tenuissimus]